MDPYKSPQHEPEEGVIPEEFSQSNLTPEQLRRWGQLTLVYLAWVFISLGLLASGEEEKVLPEIVLQSLDLIAILFNGYLLLNLQRLLWFRFGLRDIAPFIYSLIGVNIVWWFFDFLFPIDEGGSKQLSEGVFILVVVIVGVAGILLSKRVLASSYSTMGSQRFGMLLLCSSVCYVTVILALPGILLSIWVDWSMFRLFQDSARELEKLK